LGNTDLFHFSLPITNTNTDISALLKPQLKNIMMHIFLQYVCYIKMEQLHNFQMKEQIVVS